MIIRAQEPSSSKSITTLALHNFSLEIWDAFFHITQTLEWGNFYGKYTNQGNPIQEERSDRLKTALETRGKTA